MSKNLLIFIIIYLNIKKLLFYKDIKISGNFTRIYFNILWKFLFVFFEDK